MGDDQTAQELAAGLLKGRYAAKDSINETNQCASGLCFGVALRRRGVREDNGPSIQDAARWEQYKTYFQGFVTAFHPR